MYQFTPISTMHACHILQLRLWLTLLLHMRAGQGKVVYVLEVSREISALTIQEMFATNLIMFHINPGTNDIQDLVNVNVYALFLLNKSILTVLTESIDFSIRVA